MMKSAVWNVSPTTAWAVQCGGDYFGKLNDTKVIELSKYCLLIIVFVL